MRTSAFNESITCCYLYIITKYNYPPPAANSYEYLRQMKSLGFRSVELEGIRKEHLLTVYEHRHEIKKGLEEFELSLPYFCAVLPGLGSHDANERKENLELFKDLLQYRNSIVLEWIIIILIFVEVINLFIEKIFR